MKTFKPLIKKSLMLISIITTTLLLNACIAAAVTGAAAAGGASAAYVMGTLRAELGNTKSPQVAEATKRAFHTLAIKMQEYRVTEVDALVTGYTANDKKIMVKIKRVTDSVTQVTIHVGYFGDEALSDLIYQEIVKELKGRSSSGVTSYAVPLTPATEVEPAPVFEPVSVTTTETIESTQVEESTTTYEPPAPTETHVPVPPPVVESEPMQAPQAPIYPPIEQELEATPIYMQPSDDEPSSDAMPIPATDY